MRKLDRWLGDWKVEWAELSLSRAERLERSGKRWWARLLIFFSAVAYEFVALDVPLTRPNTRRDLTRRAIVCYCRVGWVGYARTLAHRVAGNDVWLLKRFETHIEAHIKNAE